MYERFYGFNERPFSLTPDPRFVVLTAAHREAITNIEYGIAGRHGITLLIGEAGSGKTTVIRYAIERQPGTVHCVHLNNPALTRAEFIEMLAAKFQLTRQAYTSKTAMLLELEGVLRQRHDDKETTVLIVDEAQSLPIELLEEIRLLANIETDQQKLLSVVLAGQPEIAARLNDPAIPQLKQRIALRCELRRLTLIETSAYLVKRIQAAGGSAVQVFSREAAIAIHEASAGLPRTVNVIADNALLTGFALNRRPVTREIVQEVCRDFDLKGIGTREVAPTVPAPATPPSQGFEKLGAAQESGNGHPAPETAPPMFANLGKPKRFSFFSKGSR
jgi:general secretion pathway protein A